MMFDRISRLPLTTAAEVSSQDVSMPKTRASSSQSPSGNSFTAGAGAVHSSGTTTAQAIELPLDQVQALPELTRGGVLDHHHQCILVGLDVVALANALRLESELLIHRLCNAIGDTHFEGNRLYTSTKSLIDDGYQQSRSHLVTVEVGIHCDVRYMSLCPHEHHARVTN